MAGLRSASFNRLNTLSMSQTRRFRRQSRTYGSREMATVKPRQTGATAVVAATGQPVVTSATGGEIMLNRAATDPAFSPLDLLYAAIAGCLAVGIRDAARRIGAIERL